MIKLLPYNEYSSKTDRTFKKLHQSLKQALPHAEIEHIGSSAIPGTLSKADLDVFVGVPKQDHLLSIEILKGLGFTEKLDTYRSDELCMLVSTPPSYELREIRIQVVALGSVHENFRTFRDSLIGNPSLVEDYNNLKLKYSKGSPNEYRKEKSSFIQKVLQNNLFYFTEISLFGRLKASSEQIALWMELTSFKMPSKGLEFIDIQTPYQWELLYQLRLKIEKSFGIIDQRLVQKMIEEVKQIKKNFDSNYYLALGDHAEPVGSIGLVLFEKNNQKFGRLLDIDIAPEFQGRGLGNKLMASIFKIAQKKGLCGLTLKADVHDWPKDWPKDWYQRIGFEEIGRYPTHQINP